MLLSLENKNLRDLATNQKADRLYIWQLIALLDHNEKKMQTTPDYL
ncbi:unnamed protein product [Acidithrix sp. C25]|nr:unnamed protein product [Acidithrix sp. C25]